MPVIMSAIQHDRVHFTSVVKHPVRESDGIDELHFVVVLFPLLRLSLQKFFDVLMFLFYISDDG